MLRNKLQKNQRQESSGSQRLQIAVVVNFLTTYREAFYKELLQNKNINLKIYCHVPPSRLNLKSIHNKFPENVNLIGGGFYFGEKVVISYLPWRKLLNDYDVVYVEGNPRYLSFALLATLLEAKKKRVVLWTMVHSYRNAKLGHFIRVAWYRIFRRILVYTEQEVSYLKSLGFKSRIVAINNAIDTSEIFRLKSGVSSEQIAAWRRLNGLEGKLIVLSCARLETKNKFEMVIQALTKIVPTHPSVVWCVIGDGSESARLSQLAHDEGVAQNVRFLGALYDEKDLAPWFMTARFLVHPGAIGLTLLHAYAYGLPVITHDDERSHGPEFAAFVDDNGACAFKKDSKTELGRAMQTLLNDEARSRQIGARGCALIAAKYDTPGMVRRFMSMALAAKR